MKIKRKLIAISLLSTFLCSCGNNENISSNNASSNSEGLSITNNKTSSFEPLSVTLESGSKFNYYLYTPENVEDNSSLVLYLHGGSGKPESEEGDLTLLTDGDGLPKFVKEKQITPNSYIVFPQLPYGKKGWSDVKNDLFSFLDKISTDLKCDKNRISITGHSMGGKGTWDIALSYPNTFHKIAPLSGAITLNDANLNKLKDKPVWAFVGSDDTIVDPQSSIDFINSLSKINSQAKITIIDGYTHFDVPNVYLSKEYNLLSWLVD